MLKKEAQLLHQAGKYAQAKIAYEQYLKTHPDDAEVWHALGIACAQSEEPDRARSAFEKAIALQKNQPAFYNSLGNICKQLKDFSQSKSAYQSAIKINPRYAAAYNNLGNLYYAQNQFVNAKKAYEKALDIQPNYVEARTNLGIVFLKIDTMDQAILHLEKAVSENPAYFPALNQLGDCYLQVKKTDQARDLFLKAIAQMPSHAEAQHRLGIAYFHLKEFEKARVQFEIVLTLDHKHAEVNQYLANTYLELKAHEKALHYYYRQLEIAPLFETYYNIGVLRMMKDQLKEALHYFFESEKIHPNDVALQLNIGNIYLKQNKKEEAIIYYQKANALTPNDPEILHILSAIEKKNAVDRAPEKYVSHLFDHYAPYYDHHLLQALHYEAPKKMLSALNEYSPESKWIVVDLGCGTGLCGALFKPFAKKLIGVDLSEKMLDTAKEKNIYDELICADIEKTLNQFSKIDLLLAADVFTYIGKLDAIFEKAHHALAQNGLFLFTVEKTSEKDFILQSSIRYAHHRDYVTQLSKKYGFSIITLDNLILRKQYNQAVEGYLVFLKKC